MAKRMLIDATHPEETRVTVVSGNRLEEFDYETETRRQLKGNIYLAKVTRVEPSLQAAFVEYGGNRHGFLAFSEIHPDYYRIPVGDREELLEEDQPVEDDDNGDEGESDKPVEELGGDEAEDSRDRRPRLKRQYKIQEVIKRRQVLLVQVVKEERGNKGAALTTYLSLAGRYCVLMPNTSRGGGVSRKIVNPADRKRLKKILAELTMPQGMAVIVRTAGSERSRAEIKRDFDYIFKLWDDIRTRTLEATAPALIHEEANLIKRALRDLYTKDMEEILVSGDDGYRTAKDFMKSLIPSHAKKVQPYRDQAIPLFQRYQVESQLAAIHEPTVMLRSGGSIVMHQTEALVSIDVNSGKATRERHIEETALKTNLEAAEEIARQLRLRDMAGLIVIDFIDMEENRNDQAVERKLKETLKKDRARIQVGRISPFGLLEMSRQRLRPSILEAITQSCPHCGGTGYIQSTDSAALTILRAIEEEGLRRRSASITVTVNPDVALYILNNKRAALGEMEETYGFEVSILTKHDMLPAQFDMTRVESGDGRVVEVTEQPQQSSPAADGDDQQEGKGRRRRRRRRGRKRQDDQVSADNESQTSDDTEADSSDSVEAGAQDGDEDGQKKRRKRGRRGGRRRGRGRDQDQDQNLSQEDGDSAGQEAQSDDQAGESGDQAAAAEAAQDGIGEEEAKTKRPRRRRGRGKEAAAEQAQEASADADTGTEPATEAQVSPAETAERNEDGEKAAPEKPAKRTRRPRKAAVSEDSPAAESPSTEAVAAEAPAEPAAADTEAPAVEEKAAEAAQEAKPAKKTRAKKTRAKKASAKKTTAKKASAKKARAKKAAAKAPDAKEAPAPDAAPAAAAEAPKTESPAPVIPAAPAPAPAAAAQPATAAAEPAKEEVPAGPKRKGWWSRVLGS